jgi:hypothetical protein
MIEICEFFLAVGRLRSKPPPNSGLFMGIKFRGFLITSKASDARRQGATTEAYGPIRRKEQRMPARLGWTATQQMVS